MRSMLAVGAMLVSMVAMLGAASTDSDKPGPGAQAPATVLQSVIGGKVESYDLQAAAAKRPVVLYFFPKAFTGGCTIEAKTFAAKYDDFSKLGYDIVGISTDDVPTLTDFAKTENAPQRFVSDPTGAITKAFGIAMDYHGKTFAGRVTFVIGTDGKILFKVDDEVPQSNIASTYDFVKKNPYTKSGT
jgi:peroxiredoxin Q/BCP